ncbi:carbon-nitrogen hydrolase family protein [Burkholderia pseudomultivorans]|uniref:carbon-nitrogen hydrolase family protein n=1 Tax=Burkholderia pseudomultivorans TaxID=1207504 RepID=UPI000751AC53|nr:carbon-nitrogen hydrolase family protein [Burkholderia pseudomultivorans]KVC55290.1 carbon-nitrogen hydrolase [Burkholderia pseudomultivorans]MDS0795519.1 carbon-nitrogen hydrolase family protein [Burkholderia pseudomultivorans]
MKLKLDIVQLAGRDGDTRYNLQRTLDAIAACAPGTDIVMFPEAQLTGFLDPSNLAECAEPLDGPSVTAVAAAARERDVAVVVGLIENDGGRFYNTTVFVTPDGIALRYRKTHLWVTEHGVVLPGDRYATVEWRGVRIGLLICYDSEFPESGRALAELGAQLILVTDGNMEPYRYVHRTSVSARAMENQVFAVVANRVGESTHDVVFAGGSLAVDPFGNLLFETGAVESRHAVELDFDQLAAARAVYDYRKDQRLRVHGERIEHPDGRRELLIP